ncbi:MAG: hypothetical protein Q9M22_00965 [Mariprofundaceae bacterium]|nr:hypothetical protein [Mariprofundaceae bacterium]
MKCPTCNRPADDTAVQCNRCGSDLKMIGDLQFRLSLLISHGYAALKSKELAQSRHFFKASLKIQHECQDAIKGLALVSLLENDFLQALSYYREYNTKNSHHNP